MKQVKIRSPLPTAIYSFRCFFFLSTAAVAYQHDGRHQKTSHDHQHAASTRAQQRPPTTHDYAIGMSDYSNPYLYMHSDDNHVQNRVVQKNMVESYKMTADPLGLCIIISNTEFDTQNLAEGAQKLKFRKGGEHDLGKVAFSLLF